MVNRRVFDKEKHVDIVTFSCHKRRTLLQPDQAKRIVIGQLGRRLAKHDGLCTGFAIMPGHLHPLVWSSETGRLGPCMNTWKDRSSHEIKKLYRSKFPMSWSPLDECEPSRQAGCCGFNIWSRQRVEEKLNCMHLNPVGAGVDERAEDEFVVGR